MQDDAPILADSHCHLDFPELQPDFAAVMARARGAGIGRFITIATEVRRHDALIALAEAHEDVFATVGTHPHWAGVERGVPADRLAALAAHPKIVGIGEVGLDRLLTDAPWDAQGENLAAHVEAARRTGLPLVIHSVGEDEEMGRVLVRAHAEGPIRVVMHCFSGGDALAEINLSRGHFLSFSGMLTFEGRDAVRAIAARVPADQLLIETDSPSLAPVPHLDRRNEPAYLRYVLRELARLRGEDEAVLARQLWRNLHAAFPKLPR